MELEVVHKPAADPKHQVVFVHGMWHGAWCWEQFQDYFAERGCESWALSLRGHGRSGGRAGRLTPRLADYVADVASVAERAGGNPIVVGHSMGGGVIRHFLAGGGRAKAAIFAAPVPADGPMGFMVRMARRRPLAFTKSMCMLDTKHWVDSPELCRELLYQETTPADVVSSTQANLGPESYRAGLALFGLPRLKHPCGIPALVVTGDRDGSFTLGEGRKTATAWGCDFTPLVGASHDLMLEPGWEKAAQAMVDWIDQKVTQDL